MTTEAKKLYIVHVGYYDKEPNFGVYEAHTNMFAVASSPQEAKQIIKAKPIYQAKKMHTDGVQEIVSVQGFRVQLVADKSLGDATEVNSFSYDSLNPAAPIGGV